MTKKEHELIKAEAYKTGYTDGKNAVDSTHNQHSYQQGYNACQKAWQQNSAQMISSHTFETTKLQAQIQILKQIITERMYSE